MGTIFVLPRHTDGPGHFEIVTEEHKYKMLNSRLFGRDSQVSAIGDFVPVWHYLPERLGLLRS
jgi:hypothetical protein